MCPLGTARLGNRETDRLAVFVRRSFKTNVSGKHLCFLDVLYKTETEPIKTFYERFVYLFIFFILKTRYNFERETMKVNIQLIFYICIVYCIKSLINVDKESKM